MAKCDKCKRAVNWLAIGYKDKLCLECLGKENRLKQIKQLELWDSKSVSIKSVMAVKDVAEGQLQYQEAESGSR